MRTLIIATALLAASAAHAEPKHTAKEAAKPIAAKEADLAVAEFQPKVIEAKPIEIATPELELKTKELPSNDLDRKLAKRSAKAAQASEASVMREPPKAPQNNNDTAGAEASTTAPIKP